MIFPRIIGCPPNAILPLLQMRIGNGNSAIIALQLRPKCNIVAPLPAFAFHSLDQRSALSGKNKNIAGEGDVFRPQRPARSVDARIEFKICSLAIDDDVFLDPAPLGLKISHQWRVHDAGSDAEDAVGDIGDVIIGDDMVLADDANPPRALFAFPEDEIAIHRAAVAMSDRRWFSRPDKNDPSGWWCQKSARKTCNSRP